MSLKLFNTLTAKKELFSPQTPGQVKMYACGPTVYDFAHIGNLRTYVFEDLLRKTMEYLGYEVIQIMNITDIDDKTIRRSREKGIPLKEYTERYTRLFLEDLRTLEIREAKKCPKATECLPDMIDMICRLIDTGYAYRGKDQNIYFSVRKFSTYGCLSHLDLSSLKEGASGRLDVDEYDKENAGDFVLWKSYLPERDGSVFWESPFGPGRPGWHIECSAMAIKYLGHTLDIHLGGVDNIFPHHENERAQSECFSGKNFCSFWVHAEHLLVNGKKMSKSAGNYFTLGDLLKRGFTGKEVRYMLLQTHYKTPLNFTLEGMQGAKNALRRLQNFIDRLSGIRGTGSFPLDPLLLSVQKKFEEALFDDLNIPEALAALFEGIREINILIDENKLSAENGQSILRLFRSLNRVLSLFSFDEQNAGIPETVQEALQKRKEAREKKDWKEADRQRDEILSMGYLIEDSPEGVRLKKISS